MPLSIPEFKIQNPEYADMDNVELAHRFYDSTYSDDFSRPEFFEMVGLDPASSTLESNTYDKAHEDIFEAPEKDRLRLIKERKAQTERNLQGQVALEKQKVGGIDLKERRLTLMRERNAYTRMEAAIKKGQPFTTQEQRVRSRRRALDARGVPTTPTTFSEEAHKLDEFYAGLVLGSKDLDKKTREDLAPILEKYGHIRDKKELTEALRGERLSVALEKGGIEKNPWVDPLAAFEVATGATVFTQWRKGALTLGSKSIGTVAGKSALSGILNAAGDYPLGLMGEAISEKHPVLALPAVIITGIASGRLVDGQWQRIVRARAGAKADRMIRNIEKIVQSKKFQTRSLTLKESFEEAAGVGRPRAKAAAQSAEVFEQRAKTTAFETLEGTVPGETRVGKLHDAADTFEDKLAKAKTVQENIERTTGVSALPPVVPTRGAEEAAETFGDVSGKVVEFGSGAAGELRVNRLRNALETFRRGIGAKTAKQIDDATPEQVKAIWNNVTHGDKELEDFIKGLSGGRKKELLVGAMRGKLPEWFDFKRTTTPVDDILTPEARRADFDDYDNGNPEDMGEGIIASIRRVIGNEGGFIGDRLRGKPREVAKGSAHDIIGNYYLKMDPENIKSHPKYFIEQTKMGIDEIRGARVGDKMAPPVTADNMIEDVYRQFVWQFEKHGPLDPVSVLRKAERMDRYPIHFPYSRDEVLAAKVRFLYTMQKERFERLLRPDKMKELIDFSNKHLAPSRPKLIPNFLTNEGGWIVNPFRKKPTRKLPQFTGQGAKAFKLFKDAQDATKALEPSLLPTWKRVYEKAHKEVVDTSGPLRIRLGKAGSLGEQVNFRHQAIAGAHPKALHDLEETLKPKIYGDLDEVERSMLDMYIPNRRLYQRYAAQGLKTPQGVTGDELNAMIAQIPPSMRRKLEDKANTYFAAMRTILDERLEEGLISKGDYDNLAKFDMYSPLKFLNHIDPEVSTRVHGVSGRRISVRSSGLEFVKEGADELFDTNSSRLLEQAVISHNNIVFRNRANKTAAKLADDLPDNGIFKHNTIVKPARVDDKGKFHKAQYADTPKGWTKIAYRTDGQTRELLIRDEVADQWVKSDPLLTQGTAKFFRIVSGSFILKPLATGLNPEFAFTNFFRDIALVWASDYRKLYSSLAPKAMLELGSDLKATFKDAVSRKGAYNRYIAEGGGMEFLTHQGRFIPETHVEAHKTLVNLQKKFGWLGETSEVWVRLALRNRAMRNGINSADSSMIARTYLDFSQGGRMAKAMDSGLPYFNASIQAMRASGRAFAKDPALFAWKMSQIGVMAGGLYFANRYRNPEAFSQVSEYDRNANWIMTTPYSFEDADGVKRHVYFRIAKDQGQQVFATLFESLAAVVAGDEVKPERIREAALNMFNITPSQFFPPTAKAVVGVMGNYDMWKGEKVWKGKTETDPYLEYTKYTHPVFVNAGKATGVSPERTRFALRQYFTSGNIYTSFVGHGYNLIGSAVGAELPEGAKDRELFSKQFALNIPAVRRIARYTDPWYKYGESLGEFNIEANTERAVLNKGLDKVTDQMEDGEATMADVRRYIQEAPPEERKRLFSRYRNYSKMQGLPERRYWAGLIGIKSPKGRARAYYARWEQGSEEEQKNLDKIMRRLPGMVSPQFIREFNKLKREQYTGGEDNPYTLR